MSAGFFSKTNFFKKILSELPSECQTVWIQIRPDILSNCFQRLSADDTSRQRVNNHWRYLTSVLCSSTFTCWPFIINPPCLLKSSVNSNKVRSVQQTTVCPQVSTSHWQFVQHEHDMVIWLWSVWNNLNPIPAIYDNCRLLAQFYCLFMHLIYWQWRIQRGLNGFAWTPPLFLNILWTWNNLVSMRPNYFIFMGYLRKRR